MNNLKIAFRNLKKNKLYSIVNLIGMAVAFSVTIVLFLFILEHYSFDKKVPDRDNVYRIISRIENGTFRATTFGAVEDPLKQYPEIESLASFYCHHQRQEYLLNNQTYALEKNINADSNFLRFFGIDLIAGDDECLSLPNSAVLPQKTANTLFGNSNPIGKTLLTAVGEPNSPKIAYTITGICKNMPKRAHFDFDILLSKSGAFEGPIEHINNSKIFGAYIYVRSEKNLVGSSIEKDLINMTKPKLDGQHGPPMEAFESAFQPLSDIHFNGTIERDFKPHIRKSFLNILLAIASIVFISALFNYMVMNVNLADSRDKQNKIFQFVGGNRFQLLKVTFWEAVLIIMFASTLSVLLMILLNPGIKLLLSSEWKLAILNQSFWLILFCLSFVILVASFPATLSKMFRSKKRSINNSIANLNKTTSLVIIQFVSVIALLGFNFMVKKQLNFIQSKELGYNAENVAYVHVPGRRANKVNALKTEISKVSGVQSVGVALHFPGRRYQDGNFETPTGNYPYRFAMVDADAIKTLGIKTSTQFNFKKDEKLVINQTFLNSLSKEYSENQIINGTIPIKHEEDESTVKFAVDEVVEDFHYNSLYSEIGNFLFIVSKPESIPNRYFLIRFDQTNADKILSEVEQSMKLVDPSLDVEFSFLNEQLNAQYQSEQKLLLATKLFSWITVLITSFGLFAFSLISIRRRTKEIGIRKVNGAKVTEVLALLNKHFIKWVAIAFLIACPISWYAMNKWLENFAYKTALSWWIFALAGGLALGIALLTVSIQSYKAATRNPVEALRYE